MTKQELQAELKSKLKAGVKPSHLKRSKSDGDISKTPVVPSPPPPPNELLQDQLNQKQKEIETLRKQLEEAVSAKQETSQKLTETTAQLDNSLEARNQSLKEWDKQQERIKQLEDLLSAKQQELNENVDEASQELINQDQQLVDLRKELAQLKLTNQTLQRDLDLTRRAVKLQDYALPRPETNWIYLKLALYSLVAVLLAYWLVKSPK